MDKQKKEQEEYILKIYTQVIKGFTNLAYVQDVLGEVLDSLHARREELRKPTTKRFHFVTNIDMEPKQKKPIKKKLTKPKRKRK